MNKVELEITKVNLKAEKKTLNELQQIYKKARQDVQQKIAELNSRTDMQNLQSIVYQKKYQQAILDQINETIVDLKSGQYKTVDEYLHESYENGYLGMMYSLQSQDIPVIMPIDDRKVVKALTTDSKLVVNYYKADPVRGRLEEDIDLLKTRIRTNLSRGIVAGKSWVDVAVDIATGMNNPFDTALKDAMRIVRTEGHRVNQQGFLDAGDVAKSKGADILKQWDATMDKHTRPWHREADGQIVEWDEDFLVMGERLKAPSIGGSARNVINCRCQLLQRARWMLDEDELKELQERAEFFGLDKTKSFEEYKQKYLNLPEKADTMKVGGGTVITTPKESSDDKFNYLLKRLQHGSVDYKPVLNHTKQMSETEIIEALAGGDRTQGSCASLGLAYIGQKQGWNILDFRDGSSRNFFSSSWNLHTMSEMKGMKVLKAEGASALTVGNRLLKQCEVGKEYYLCVGRHASIVRKTPEGVLQYLELQSASRSGWTDFDKNARHTLNRRFGCTSTSDSSAYYDFMIDIDESDFSSEDDFKTLLGFINTSENEQRKGSSGTIK